MNDNLYHAHNTHRLAPGPALSYILAGKGRATLVGREHRYTYRFSANNQGTLIFVQLLTGPENANPNDYQYLGYIEREDIGAGLVSGRKGCPDFPAYKALNWYLHMICSRPSTAAKAEFWHEGECGACGRTLTDPASIERGFGPKCAERVR